MRLTKKYDGNYHQYDGTYVKPQGEDSKDWKDKCVNKLGQYEDLEEELKCPLDFCITPYRLSGLKKIWYRKQWCEVVRIVIYEEATRPYMEVRVKELKNLKIVFLDGYGITWTLTKEELI